MRHLSPDTFVDLLDGTLDESAVPHLVACATCRQRLDALRQTWTAAADLDVPEPSPLFWDHLSARVREAVASEPAPAHRALGWGWRIAGLAGAAAAAVTLVMTLHAPRDSRSSLDATRGTAAASPASFEPLPRMQDDPSLIFVADLASHVDWDSAPDAGLAPRGVADRVVAEMDQAERAELQRLLNEALSKPDQM